MTNRRLTRGQYVHALPASGLSTEDDLGEDGTEMKKWKEEQGGCVIG